MRVGGLHALVQFANALGKPVTNGGGGGPEQFTL